MALGAERRSVLGQVLGQGFLLSLIGIGIGIAAGVVLTRFLGNLLFEVKPQDPLTFLAVSLVMMAVALLSCYVPARRATRVDPARVLRTEWRGLRGRIPGPSRGAAVKTAPIAVVLLLTGWQAHAQELTPKALDAALQAKPSGPEADALAERIRTYFGGKELLLRGTAAPKIDELTVAWAVELPQHPADGPPPRVVSDVVHFTMPLTRVGSAGLYAGVATFSHGDAFSWHYESNDLRRLGGGQLEVYETHADSREKPGVPKGTTKQMPPWKSKIFEGTTRDWWVYVPAQYKPETPAAVMVFQDGNSYREYVPTVFDNLIAQGAMPVTVGIFIQPGLFDGGRSNRSFEYDTLSDQYARFLLEEILPEVDKTVKLRRDAAGRAIAGASSGGICAFTVAWERPNEFSKVLSWIGSFVNIASGKTVREGGHNYEAMIRKTPKKAIRVFLQDGSNDLDNANGNWPLANQTLAKSLAYARYDYRFVYGDGFHSHRHGRAIMPDSLRWLWRDHAQAQVSVSSSR